MLQLPDVFTPVGNHQLAQILAILLLKGSILTLYDLGPCLPSIELTHVLCGIQNCRSICPAGPSIYLS